MVLPSPWPRYSQNYDRAADGLLADIRTTKPAKGHDRVLYPGLRGAEITAERKANGIPYHPEVIVWFHRVSRRSLRTAALRTRISFSERFVLRILRDAEHGRWL